jgi:uncharacterized protein YjlB
MIAIRYIGHRSFYVEGAYGSKIEFIKGETVLVPDDLAAKLLKHADVYELGADTEAAQPAIIPSPNPNQEPEEDIQSARDLVANMDTVDALVEFAATNFSGRKLDKRLSIPKLRREVTRFIDLYGIT